MLPSGGSSSGGGGGGSGGGGAVTNLLIGIEHPYALGWIMCIVRPSI